MLQNACLLVKIGADTAENTPNFLEVEQNSAKQMGIWQAASRESRSAPGSLQARALVVANEAHLRDRVRDLRGG